MFKNYFKTAWRNLSKNKITSLINVLGLSVGISAALIIYMLIEYDFSFDKYEPQRQSIYRIVSEGDGWKNAGVPSPLHQTMQNNISGIENTAAVFKYNEWNPKITIPKGNNHIPQIFKNQDYITFVDSNYFSIFPHEWIAGNAKSSLQNPYNVVLSL